MQLQDIGWAILQMRHLKRVTREVWKSEFLKMFCPGRNTDMTEPYIFIVRDSGARIPWVPSQEDLLSTDWRVLN